MDTFIEILLFVVDILMSFTACAVVIICARKQNIHHDKQSVFYRKRILFSIIAIILSGCSVVIPFLLKNSSYDSIGLPKIAFMISVIPAIVTLLMALVNIPALKDFPEVELTGEDIAFFQHAFSDVFTRIQKYSNETLTRLEKETAGVPEHRAKYIIRCVWYFLKHLLSNTMVSHSTGTDPSYLDSGAEAFLKHERYVLMEPGLSGLFCRTGIDCGS